MGADVLLVDRPSGSDLGLGHQRRHEVMLRGRRSVTLDLKSAERRRGGAAPGRARRRDRRRLSPRRDGAPRPRPRGAAGAQSEAGVRPHDRLGPGRAAGRRAPATTSTTSPSPARCTRSAAPARRRCRRSTWSATSAAAACCSPSASPAALIEARASGRGQVVDAAMVDGAALLDDDVLRHARRRQLERGARRQHPRHRRALVRQLRDARRQVRRDRRDRAEVLRRAAAAPRTRSGDAAEAARPRRLAALARALRRRLRRPHAATSGAPRSKAPTPASRRCSRSPNRAAIRTSRRAPGRSRSPASTSRRRRRASTAPRARQRRPPPERGEGGAAALADWGFDAAAIEDLGRLGVGFAR